MAEWSKNKVEPIEINKGKEFNNRDNLAINELNAIVNNSFYASEKAKRAEELAESAVRGNGTIVTIDGQIQGEWSADFAESERQKTLSLFNPDTITRGYSLSSADGSMLSDSLWYVSDYIDVRGLSGVLIEGNRDSGQSNCFYDANKTFISTYKAIKGYVPVPSNAVYMRINGIQSQLGDGYTIISQGDIIHNNIIQGMNGVVLWENPNKKSPFTPQTITLSASIANFDYLILEYEAYMPSNDVYNCRQYSYFRPIVDGALEVLSGGWDEGTRYIKARSFKIKSETQIEAYTGWQESASNDRMVVPLKIFGVKKGV